jgi:ectoine hydroxylase-related dioxygenase (phytanoyl-CoA dioxygenase family)
MNTEEMQQQFSEQGFVILKKVFAPSQVERVRDAMKALVDLQAKQLLAEGKISDPMEDASFETRLARLYENHLEDAPKSFRTELHLAGLYDFFFNPRLLDVVQMFLGDEIRLYPNYTARPKLPDHAGTVVLWHQDGGYTESASGGSDVNELRMVNVWSPLVPARVENGCMQFVPGTHRLGVVPHERKEHYLEIAPEFLEPRVDEAINVELDPGDAVLFHNLLFHRGLPNHSKTIRWSLDWRYQDATQPTLRKESGHLARSQSTPQAVVQSAAQWEQLHFS